MYNCYCDLPIWDWFKQQPKSYFETIIREGGMVDVRSDVKDNEEWKLHYAPCNTSEKLVLREIIQHYATAVAGCKITRVELVSYLGVVKKFTFAEFMNSVKNMKINLTDEIILIRADGRKTGYQSHSIQWWDGKPYAEHDHRLIVEWWGKALRKHYAERDQFWLQCKTLEEFYTEYPKEIWGEHWNRDWDVYLGR